MREYSTLVHSTYYEHFLMLHEQLFFKLFTDNAYWYCTIFKKKPDVYLNKRIPNLIIKVHNYKLFCVVSFI